MKMGDVAKLTVDQRKKWSLQFHLKSLRETALAADQGRWSRSHSVVQSWDKGRTKNTVIALAEGFEGSLHKNYVGSFWAIDPAKESANTRHIVNSSPRAIVAIIDKIWELFPELKDYD